MKIDWFLVGAGVVILALIALFALALVLTSGPHCTFEGGASGTCVLPSR